MLKDIARQKEKGFTLIELMIVIAIIGILAAIAIPQFSAYRTRSFNSTAQADLRNAATAQEAYYTDNRTYAGDTALLVGNYISDGVDLQISSASKNGYTIVAYHERGNKTYTLTGPGGVITGD
jgi:prepilin-type N-terminal cleavage/methylation domain-containing protein